ncbi:MAG: AMP-binding protein [Candidatus Rokubacteria bacterium]|nr:AMP-binding protein [Candidatus Rokubacteria bacterium]
MEPRYLEPEIETASREALIRLETERLRAQVEHAYRGSPFYRRRLDQAGVKPGDVRTLEDLGRLPFTTKDELKQSQADHPLWGDFLAVPFEECLRVHMTSATTGRPLAFLDTKDDWRGFYHSYARSLYAYGVRKSDMVMAAFSYGPWIGYWSGFYAAQDLGALVFPAGGLSTDQRIDALLTYPITVLGCTPSYALFLAEQAAKKGIDLAKQTRIRITWHTGEPGASIPATKAKIEAAFGARAFDLPGLTEIAAWGFECDAQAGLTHVHEDYCYPEVLDEGGRPVKPGETGELVLTSLYRKAMPLLRYRTRDIVRLANRACPCGRTLVAFEGGVLARLDDMKKIRGIIVYPRRIEEIVRAQAAVDEFQVVFRRVEGLDDILVRVDPSPSLSLAERDGLRGTLARELQVGLGIRVSVEAGESGSLPRWDHKARRVKDERTDVPF